MSKKAIAIKLNSGCSSPQNCKDISKIKLEINGSSVWETKAAVYNRIKDKSQNIEVDISPYPLLVAVKSSSGEKYVRSESNDTSSDNLLKLPQE